jgi:hypothetical protein
MSSNCPNSREIIRSTQRKFDPDGVDARNPTAKKIPRAPVVTVGPNQIWGGDGHDKLYSCGFPLYAFTDTGTGYVLGGFFAPSNRRAVTVAYMFLCIVEKYKGVN